MSASRKKEKTLQNKVSKLRTLLDHSKKAKASLGIVCALPDPDSSSRVIRNPDGSIHLTDFDTELSLTDNPMSVDHNAVDYNPEENIAESIDREGRRRGNVQRRAAAEAKAAQAQAEFDRQAKEQIEEAGRRAYSQTWNNNDPFVSPGTLQALQNDPILRKFFTRN